MRRLFRMSFLSVMLLTIGLISARGQSRPEAPVSGRIASDEVRIFSKDTIYKVEYQLVVAGTLIIEPGTTLKFAPNGRIIDSTGGRLIADAYANASYTAKPDGIDPMPGNNNKGWTGYADLNYFLYGNTIVPATANEPTIHADKRNHVYNVVLNKTTRGLRDFSINNGGRSFTLGADEVIIPFEKAIVYRLAGLQDVTDPVNDIRNNLPFRRPNTSADISIISNPINFIGQVTNNFTREKGHIIILPGARAAFFRGCNFENMRKDTTVDNNGYYANAPYATAMNSKMIKMLNGAGGAISTFSSRTWLVNCNFSHNMARNAGGALQILQTPEGFPTSASYAGLPVYPADKNPNITEINGDPSNYNTNIKRIDNLDESSATPEYLTDYERQAYDDARLSVLLGRMRNLKFDYNQALLSNVKIKYFGSIPVIVDDDSTFCVYPQNYGNFAKGGALFIAGRTTVGNQMEIALGVNTKIKTTSGVLTLAEFDTVEFNSNFAKNYQMNLGSEGAMGGAIYLGANTSLLVAGKFNSNEAVSPFMGEPVVAANTGKYAKGGAIYQENTLARLQVRSYPVKTLIVYPTLFSKNKAGNGGAIYVNGNDDATMSPIIGGSDRFPKTRDYGYNIKFEDNVATAEGGAIYTRRNMRINGAGGVDVASNDLIGYSDDFRVIFDRNEAGYSGGAVTIDLPFVEPALPAAKRAIHFARVLFRENKVGYNITESLNRAQVRGGGAVYSCNADMNVVKGVEFNSNSLKNGNGGALAMVHPVSFTRRFFVSDLDVISYDANGVAQDYTSYNDPFIHNHETAAYAADARMLTRFLDNVAEYDDDMLESQNGTGITQITSGTVVTNATINAVEFVDALNGIAVGTQGTIIKLSNAGAVWEYRNLTTPHNLKGIHFTTNLIGYIVGDRGLVLKTVDAGNNWTEVRPATSNYNLHAITFINSLDGYAVGQFGKMIKTNNSGATWTEITSRTVNNLNAVKFIGVNTGYAVGNGGTILSTIDGGLNWEVLSANTRANFNSIYFTDNTNGFIAGEGVIFKTVNGGAAWNNVYADGTKNFKSITFTGLNNGYAVGTFGTMLVTNDAGTTWNNTDVKLNNNKVYNTFNEIFFATPATAVIGGDNGLMVRTTNTGADWSAVLPINIATVDVKRYHPGVNMRENGIGLGGAIYILDSVSTRSALKDDYIKFNRVRIENNSAFTGSAVYSDNFDLKLVFSRSLVYGNEAKSNIGMNQNAISGPALDLNKDNVIEGNYASSDLAGAALYGEIVGPLPYESTSWAGNSFYGNNSRFLIRLPDAPNTKGALAGSNVGLGGIDTLRGNYWGKSEADVTMYIDNLKDLNYPGRTFENMPTFFVDKCDQNYLTYRFNATDLDTLKQGPFEVNGTFTRFGIIGESITKFSYIPVPLRNGTSENQVGSNSIPEKYLFSGRVYDLFDKGTDIKVADYANRRLSPIEDFAVGIPVRLRVHQDDLHPNNQTYLTRWLRDPAVVEATNADGTIKYPMIAALQGEWRPNKNGEFYHPVGYPLFLEAKVNYDGDIEQSNHDTRLLNESVFFVINETTGDFIRTNMKQVAEDGINWETFRSRVELIPDMTKRNSQTTIRRSAEKLLNLGIGDVLLYALKSNPSKEDSASLQGRKYYGHKEEMGGRYMTGQTTPGITDLYINKDNWAPSNENTATYFGGEKYQALPVDTGDVVRIISRTMLWKYGVVKAFDEGISFKVTRSIMPPDFTGDVVKLQNLANEQWRNKVLVTEDRTYPVNDGTYSSLGYAAGRDSILTITAIDNNNMYDPRALDVATADYYAKLKYSLYLNGETALSRWLRYTIIPAGQPGNENEKDSANGYMVLRGTPMNPYVVPSGENATVKVENFPPHVVTINALKNLYGQDTLDKFIYIFPPYMHAPNYDVDELATIARYLQQDTINYASTYYREYTFKIFTIDSTPRFLSYNSDPEVFYKDVNYNPVKNMPEMYQDSNSVRVMYLPSVYRNGFCAETKDNKLIASLTDKLRLQADFNTDDEAEDYWAKTIDAWDFKFGKTSYGFYNIARRDNPDESVITDEVIQTRPIWMANDNIYKFNDETNKDQFAADFTSNGQLNIRLDGATARDILGVREDINNAMNLDTVFTVVANDGHGGMTMMPVDVYVNVAPTIKNTTAGDRLPDAKEGEEYNPGLNDPTKKINIYDPNYDQNHRFELIYPNDTRNKIPKDPCFSEAGYWNISDKKTTPSWLKINPNSGILYGTPSVSDNIIPNQEQEVTVLVWDLIEQEIPKQKINTLEATATNVFAIGQNGTIIRVNKSNKDWSFIKVSGIEAFNLFDISFVDNTGYIVGSNGLILKTNDGGSTWNIKNTTYRTFNLKSVDFFDADNGVVVGEQGKVFTTIDGGNTWTEKKTDFTTTYNKVKMLSASNFVILGAGGRGIRTTNSGTTFSNVTTSVTSDILDAYFINNLKGFAVTNSNVLNTDDGGASWTSKSIGMNSINGIGYFDINDNVNFTASDKANNVFISANKGQFAFTKDAGATWNVKDAPASNIVTKWNYGKDNLDSIGLNDVLMLTSNSGLFVGTDGVVASFTTTDRVGDPKDSLIAVPVILTTKNQDMLSAVRTFKMIVDTVLHKPIITDETKPLCIDLGTTTFVDTLYVFDQDLKRPNFGEEVTIKVISPLDPNWKIRPSKVTKDSTWTIDPQSNDTIWLEKVPFFLYYDGALNTVNSTTPGFFTVVIEARDKDGHTDTLTISYRYSEKPDFISVVTIANALGQFDELKWGTAFNTTDKPVTTGEGILINGEITGEGNLDSIYCEYELPPVPYLDIFDARWVIPLRKGLSRNIHPRCLGGASASLGAFRATFQSGGESAGASDHFPIYISWRKSEIPSRNDLTINPAGSVWYITDAPSQGDVFYIDMKRGEGRYNAACNLISSPSEDIVTIQLNENTANGINIVYDCIGSLDVKHSDNITEGIQSAVPNPIETSTTINFGVKEYANVTIEIYDAIGNSVNTLANDFFSAGYHSIQWDGLDFTGRQLASGTYTVRMISGTVTSTYQVKIVR